MTRLTLPLAALFLPLASSYTFNDTLDICIWNRPGPLSSKHPTTCSPVYLLDQDTAAHFPSPHPWSLPPSCVRAAYNPLAQYCVFTTHAFRGTSSLSIITTPKIASLLHADNVIHDPIYEWAAARAVTPSNVPRRPHPAHVRWDEEEDATVEGRGQTLLAKREIKKGEVILVAYPRMIGRMRFTKSVSPEQERRLVREAVERLPEKERGEVLRLARRGKGGEVKVEDVLKTNIFAIEIGGSQHFGVFPSLSVGFAYH
jgi:hypothetical protein